MNFPYSERDETTFCSGYNFACIDVSQGAKKKKYKKCVKEIMSNISGRRGFSMDNLDEDIIDEIREELKEILKKYL